MCSCTETELKRTRAAGSEQEGGGASEKSTRAIRIIHSSIYPIHSFIYLRYACIFQSMLRFQAREIFAIDFSTCPHRPPPPPKLRPRLVLGPRCSSLSSFVCKQTFLRPLYTSAQFLRVGGECSGEMVAVVMEFIRAAGNRLFLKEQLWKGGWTAHEL